MKNQDVFLISSDSEIRKNSSLMNRASKAYWRLQDRTTLYAQSIYACYYLHRRIADVILEVQREYKQGEITYE